MDEIRIYDICDIGWIQNASLDIFNKLLWILTQMVDKTIPSQVEHHITMNKLSEY